MEMEFTKESTIVQAWVRLVNDGKYKEEQIPALGNLKDIVLETINSNQ